MVLSYALALALMILFRKLGPIYCASTSSAVSFCYIFFSHKHNYKISVSWFLPPNIGKTFLDDHDLFLRTKVLISCGQNHHKKKACMFQAKEKMAFCSCSCSYQGVTEVIKVKSCLKVHQNFELGRVARPVLSFG